MSTDPARPGRLGDPERSLGTDPRSDPRMVAALAPFGMDANGAEVPLPSGMSSEEILATCGAFEEGFGQVFGALAAGNQPVSGVARETRSIPGPDGNDVTVYIHKPADASGPLPGMVHFHGGGMVILDAAAPTYQHWRDLVAATGMVVVGVEFRNGAGKLGAYPFPAGLNDCVAATRWTLDNAGSLGIGKVILSGESGGANLSLSVAMRAKREGWVDRIAGIYGLCPFIHGDWANPPADVPSLAENQGYFFHTSTAAVLAAAYDPTGENAGDPTAWPLRATTADVEGLPPVVISVNELDPVRDEGLNLLRVLQAAGVDAIGRVVAGTCHAAEVAMPSVLPNVAAATIRDIHGFAASL